MFSIGLVCWIACLIVPKNVYLLRYPCPIDLIHCLCDDLDESHSEFHEVSLSITNIKKLNATYRRFRLGSWNVQGLNCTRKQVEISEILHKNNIDLLVYRRVGR